MKIAERKRPEVPKNVRWPIRCIHYAACHLPRGYAKLIRAIASVVPSLQQLELEIPAVGPFCLDLRESVCIPFFIWGCYPHQVPEDRILMQVMPVGGRAFDIGANVGYYTRLLARAAGPHGEVVAVEPAPRALRLLTRNASLSPCRVAVVPCAVGSARGLAQLVESANLDTSYVCFTRAREGHLVTVLTVDDLADRYGVPDLIKLDVEGAELLVLRGAEQTLGGLPKPIIMFEYVNENAQVYGDYSLEEVVSLLTRLGYRVYRVAWPAKLRCALDETDATTNNYFAVPADRLQVLEPFVERASCRFPS